MYGSRYLPSWAKWVPRYVLEAWWGVLPPAGEPDHELQDKSKQAPRSLLLTDAQVLK